jgi:uncharacterized membrane protein
MHISKSNAVRLIAEAVEVFLLLSPADKLAYTKKMKKRLPRFFWMTVRASLISFVILAFMPVHPIAIPTAFGGGIAFALITYL